MGTEIRARLATSVLVAACFLASVAATVPASASGASCDLDSLILRYNAGNELDRDGLAPQAVQTWRALAEWGFPPAQRRLAEAYRDGRGVPRDPELALLWGQIAWWGADRDGRRLAREVGRTLPAEVRRAVLERAGEFTPSLAGCDDNSATEDGMPAIGATEAVRPHMLRRMEDRLAVALGEVRDTMPLGPLVLLPVDTIEVVAGDHYDRYVGWRASQGEPARDVGVLRVSDGYLHDEDHRFLAVAIAFAGARRIYDRLSDSEIVDPFVSTLRGKAVYTPVYPDVDAAPFLRRLDAALELGRDLPPRLAAHLKAIDEIHYAPPSRLYGDIGPEFYSAYYNKQLGDGGGIVFVRRDVERMGAAELVLTLVHEGTHVLQDRVAKGYIAAVPALERHLTRLRATGRDERAARLQARIERMRNYTWLWYRGEPARGTGGASGGQRAVDFECAALSAEIEAAKVLGLDRALVAGSPYVDACEEAHQALVAWRPGHSDSAVR